MATVNSPRMVAAAGPYPIETWPPSLSAIGGGATIVSERIVPREEAVRSGLVKTETVVPPSSMRSINQPFSTRPATVIHSSATPLLIRQAQSPFTTMSVATQGPSEADIIESALNEARVKLPAADSGSKDVMEAALREARLQVPLERGLLPPTMDYSDADTANVHAYGAQLKSWIDMNVDMRLDSLLPALTQENAILAGELDVMKEMQSKLFAVVEGLSEEVVTLKALISGNTQAKLCQVVETLSKDLARTQVAVAEEVDRLKTSLASCELATRRVTTEEIDIEMLLADLRAETSAALQSESEAIARLDKRLWLVDQRLEKRIDDIVALPLQTVRVSQSPERSRSPVRIPSPRGNSPARWNIIGGRLISEQSSNMFDEHLKPQDVLRITTRA